MQPTWEPASSLQQGPDTYPWASLESWVNFCHTCLTDLQPDGYKGQPPHPINSAATSSDLGGEDGGEGVDSWADRRRSESRQGPDSSEQESDEEGGEQEEEEPQPQQGAAEQQNSKRKRSNSRAPSAAPSSGPASKTGAQPAKAAAGSSKRALRLPPHRKQETAAPPSTCTRRSATPSAAATTKAPGVSQGEANGKAGASTMQGAALGKVATAAVGRSEGMGAQQLLAGPMQPPSGPEPHAVSH